MDQQEIKKITDYLFLPARVESADLALVFGTRMTEPVAKVKEIYAAGLVPKILLSGGVNCHTGRVEAQDMADQLLALGVAPEDLLVEDQSTNSLENVLFAKRLIEESLSWAEVKRVAVVCKNYHSRRALMTLRKHFPSDVELLPVPYDLLDFSRDNWFLSDVGREKVLEEWKKIPFYLAKGDICEL